VGAKVVRARKLVVLFLCLVLLAANFGLGATYRFKQRENVLSIEPTKEYPKTTGLLLIGWSIYAGWLGYTMFTGDFDIKTGDWKIVGGFLLGASVVTFCWGISLVF